MNNKEVTITIVVPCLNEQDNVIPFFSNVEQLFTCRQTADSLASERIIKREYIFIDDGSTDNTLSVIRSLHNQHHNVKYISFTRNFGKEAALYAGLQHSSGNYVAVMDADLQDPPGLLLDMFDYICNNQEFDCVAAYRSNRNGEAKIRSVCAKIFYKIINLLSDVYIVEGARDFRIMSRRMVDSILLLQERERFSKGIFSWVGYKTYYMGYDNIPRNKGKSKWSFVKLCKYSLDGIVSFSTGLLQISSIVGVLSCFAAVVLLCYFVIQKITIGIEVPGYTFLMCIILLLGGIQLLCIGILGQYIARLFLESKSRPLYLIKENGMDV